MDINEIAYKCALDKMKNNIDKLGCHKTWQLIDKLILNPKTRLRFRKLFFEAGGKI